MSECPELSQDADEVSIFVPSKEALFLLEIGAFGILSIDNLIGTITPIPVPNNERGSVLAVLPEF